MVEVEERIGQHDPAITHPQIAPIHRKPDQQDCGQKGISRQRPCRCFGQFCEADRRRREGK